MTDELSDAAAIILRHLEASGQAELPGLGTLTVRVRPERHGVDPITGKRLHVPERRVLAFLAHPDPDPRLALTRDEAPDEGWD